MLDRFANNLKCNFVFCSSFFRTGRNQILSIEDVD